MGVGPDWSGYGHCPLHGQPLNTGGRCPACDGAWHFQTALPEHVEALPRLLRRPREAACADCAMLGLLMQAIATLVEVELLEGAGQEANVAMMHRNGAVRRVADRIRALAT